MSFSSHQKIYLLHSTNLDASLEAMTLSTLLTRTYKIDDPRNHTFSLQGKPISQIASLFLKEGILIKPPQDGKKATERKAFLFDNLLVLTKQVSKKIQ